MVSESHGREPVAADAVPAPPSSPDPSPPPVEARNPAYDLLRLICIAAVVAIHSFGQIGAHPESHTFVDWFVGASLSNGVIWAVSVFVMLSGALTLTPRVHAAGPGPFLRRRALRILPALVFWTFLYLVPVRIFLLGEHLSPTQLVVILIDGTAYPQLYFLYLIAGLSIVSPVIAPFVNTGSRLRALILGIIVLTFTVVVFEIPELPRLNAIYHPIVFGTLTYWLGALGYYILGAGLSRVRFTRVVIALSAGAFVITWSLTMLRGWAVGNDPGLNGVMVAIRQPVEAALTVSVFVLGVTLLGRIRLGPRLTRTVTLLADAAFGVFLIHLLVLLIPYDLLPGFAHDTSLWQTALGYLFTLLVSFALVVGLRRIPGVRLLF